MIKYKYKTKAKGKTSKTKPIVDKNNPLEIGRSQGVRRPDWLARAEEGYHDDDQIEFVKAMDEYKRKNKRPFPMWSEILFVIKSLGYMKPEKISVMKN